MTISDDKANTLNKILDLNRLCSTFCLSRFSRYEYDPPEEQRAVNIELKLVSDAGDKLEIRTHGDLEAAVAEAWLRVERFLGRNPEFDPNKTLEHRPTEAPLSSVTGDEVPF